MKYPVWLLLLLAGCVPATSPSLGLDQLSHTPEVYPSGSIAGRTPASPEPPLALAYTPSAGQTTLTVEANDSVLTNGVEERLFLWNPHQHYVLSINNYTQSQVIEPGIYQLEFHGIRHSLRRIPDVEGTFIARANASYRIAAGPNEIDRSDRNIKTLGD